MRLAATAVAILLAAGLGGAYAAGALGGSHARRASSHAPPRPDAAELAAIRQLVLRAASKMGDPAPTNGVLVPTTRRLAELVDVDTAEADIPVYFVLVHGKFTGGALLTLTIDPETNESLGTGLVGEMPDIGAIGRPQPLPLGTEPELTNDVPCYEGHQRLVGRTVLRRFHAVTAVSCIEGTRTYPGQGEWWVQSRRVAVGSLSGLQRYFEQPNGPKLRKGEGCLLVARRIVVPTFVDGAGHWVVPRTPVDGCGQPLSGYRKRLRSVHWRLVSVHRVRLMVSAAALTAHCAMGIKDLPAGGIGHLERTSGGPLFKSAPTTVRVCIYRAPPKDSEVGSFVRGFPLDRAQTHRLLGAMTGAAPSGSCADQRTFAVVATKRDRWAEVELGGCWRVGRTYPDYGLGGADPPIVRAILGLR